MRVLTWLPLAVVGLPFAAFLILGLVRPLRRTGTGAGIVSLAALGLAVLGGLTVWVGGFRNQATWAWLPGDDGPMATVGILVDPLSRAMLGLISLVSLLVQLYSLAYLHDEPPPSLGRYFAYHALFAFSMMGLVI